MVFRKSWILILCLVFSFCATVRERENEEERGAQFHYQKAVVAMNYGFAADAVKYAEEALSHDPFYYQAYNLLGLAHLKLGNYDEAITSFKKCLDINPEFSEAHFNLAVAYENNGLMERAKEAYRKSFSLNGNVQSGVRLATIYLQQENPEGSLEIVRELLAEKKPSAELFNLEGIALNKMKRFEEAAESFQNALNIEPDNKVIMINLAVAWINNGEVEKAKIYLENLLPSIEDQSLKEKVEAYLKKIKDI